jgi:immunoglobulin-binding protein 1
MSDEQQPQNLRELFSQAEARRAALDEAPSSNTSAYQDQLAAAITLYEECLKAADRVSLFSPNETLEDVSSSNLKYLLLHYRVAELVLRITSTGDDLAAQRRAHVERAQAQYVRFLKLLDQYDVLAGADGKLFEQYQDNPKAFSTASAADATARREVKIARFKQEKELKQKLEVSWRHSLSSQTVIVYPETLSYLLDL